ncbi:MAG: signal peptidase II [Spirochaetes bacterium]|nr:signal peptidase II [Spirochaetota bacterium]
MKMYDNRKKLIKIVIIVFLTIFIDQFTKFLIIKNFHLYQSIKIIKNLLYLTYIENRGFLMGFGGQLNDGTIFNGVVIITIIAIAILIGFFIYIYKRNLLNNYLLINFSFLIGGAFGNFIDRLFRKKVIDFIEIKLPTFKFKGFYYSSLPIFNFADLFVTVGIIMLIIYFIFLEHKYEVKGLENDVKSIEEPNVEKIKNENSEYKNKILNEKISGLNSNKDSIDIENLDNNNIGRN